MAGEGGGVDFNQEAVVADELITEHQRIFAGHVAIGVLGLGKNFAELELGEEDVVVHRLHGQEVAGGVDEALGLGEGVGAEGFNGLGREGAFDEGFGRALENVSAGGLRSEVGEVEGRGLKLERFCARYFQALVAQGGDLVGVVGQDDPGGFDAEQVADVGNVFVVPVILFEPHGGVGGEGGDLIERGLDEHAVAGLADVADAAAFLKEIEEDAVALFGDDLESALELLHAVAIAAAQGLGSDATGVEAGVKGGGGGNVAVGEGDDVMFVDDVLENVGAEEAETGVEKAIGDVERGAVNGPFFESGGLEDGAGGVLEVADEAGKFRGDGAGGIEGGRGHEDGVRLRETSERVNPLGAKTQKRISRPTFAAWF